jgi:hypothetical protein
MNRSDQQRTDQISNEPLRSAIWIPAIALFQGAPGAGIAQNGPVFAHFAPKIGGCCLPMR